MQHLRIPAALLALAALVWLGSLLAFGGASRAQSDQSMLAGVISRLLSTPTTQVSIGSIEGALSSDAVIRGLRIADRDGPWLTIDRARLVWSRSALLRGRLQVELLEIGRVGLARRPAPGEAAGGAASEPLLPELPVKVVVERFALGELALGEAVLGAPARLSAEGSASLGAPSEGLDLTFRAGRLDAPGRLSAELGYVPQSNRLRLEIAHDEPEGGLVARLLDLPGLPPVALRVAGEGPLTGFAARLDFAAGEAIGAEGEARVERSGAAYRATLDLGARIGGLLPGAVAPLFSGTTRLAGEAAVADDGRIAVRTMRLAAAAAVLELAGTIGVNQDLDLRLTGRAVHGADGRAHAGTAQADALDADIVLQGPATAPRLSGTIAAAGLDLPQGRIGRLDARFEAAPAAASSADGPLRLNLAVTASGLVPADPALARAAGDRVALVARGSVDRAGLLDFEDLGVETPTTSLRYAGRLGAGIAHGTLRARLPSLAPFSHLAGRDLAGSAAFDAELTRGTAGTVVARLAGRVEEFAGGSAALDGLLGRSVDLSGTVRHRPDGLEFEELRVTAANLEAVVDGRTAPDASDLALRAVIPELRRLDPRIGAGRARIEARLTGRAQRPDGVAVVTVEDMRALHRPIPRLVLSMKGRDLAGDLDAGLTLDGEVAGKAARGTLRLARTPEGGLLLDQLAVAVGSVSLTGGLRVSPDGLAQGDVALAAGDLDDLSPLLLTRLGGRLDAAVALSSAQGAQAARISAQGSGIAAGPARLGDLKIALTGRDLLGQPVVDGTAEARAVVLAGETFKTVTFTADGGRDATRFALSATAQGLAFDAAGRLVPAAEGRRIELARLEARRGPKRIALAAPTGIEWGAGTIGLKDLTLLADGGRVAVSGQAGQVLDLTVQVLRLPLSAAAIVAPALGLSGTLDGHVVLQGSPARPRGSYEFSLKGFSAPASRAAGLRPAAVRARGQIADGRAGIQAALEAAQAGSLKATGSVPLAASGAVDLAVAGHVDLKAANAMLSASGRRASGRADIDLRIGGPVRTPRVEGDVAIRSAAFEDSVLGLRVTDVEGRLRAKGTELLLEGLVAHTPNGGRLAAGGRIRLDPAAGLPADIRVTGTRAQLASNATATAVADLDLVLQGQLLRRPRIAGRVDLVSLDVGIPDRMAAAVGPLQGARHVQPPPAAAARLDEARRRDAAVARRAPLRADLDLAIVAQNRIFVRGRGIDAEFGGDLHLTGSSDAPVANGAFEMRHGRLDILSQRLSFSHGRLEFGGDLVPAIDFLAETRSGSVTARIAVAGPASKPEFRISSDPSLPQDEVLSYILFQRAAGALSPGQAVQLAQAAASFAGGTDSGTFDRVRRSLGVDSLDIGANARGGPAVGASKYISDRVRIGVRAGAKPEDSTIAIDLDITRRLKAQSEVGPDGRSAVGVGVEWEY